jgi:hypothetical protein
MQGNPRHKNGCDYCLMLQDMNQKRNSLCGMSFVFFFRKISVCGESQTILLCIHIDPDISSQNQTSNKKI